MKGRKPPAYVRVKAAAEVAEAGYKYLTALCHYSYMVLGRDKRDAHWEHEVFTVIGRIQGALGGGRRDAQANMGEGRWLPWSDAADELLLNMAQIEHSCYGECEATVVVLLGKRAWEQCEMGMKRSLMLQSL